MALTKGAVADGHHNQIKEQYGDRRLLDYGRTAIVIGAEEGNIGGSIVSSLKKSQRFGAGDDYGSVIAHSKAADGDVLAPGVADRLPFGDADTLVLANGFSRLDWLEEMPEDAIVQTANDNLLASQMMTRDFVKATLETPWLKNIVFVGSMAHKSVLNASSYYCAAKAGLAAFARCAAWELTPKGYRVFSVHPSNTKGTPMTEETIEGIARYRGIDREAAENYWGAINLMPEWLQGDDIGEVVLWLVTNPAAQYLSGSDIELKAGQR